MFAGTLVNMSPIMHLAAVMQIPYFTHVLEAIFIAHWVISATLF